MAAAAAAAQDSSWLARHYIDYVYIPGALLVVGTLIVKREWAPYSILLALVLGAYNFWNFRESRRPSPLSALLCLVLPLPHTRLHSMENSQFAYQLTPPLPSLQRSRRSSSLMSSRSLSSRKRPSSPTMSPCKASPSSRGLALAKPGR